MEQKIAIRGARQHNLKNIDLEIPKNKLVVFTGVSGSGKTSLAFDTIYAEGQRRYVESLSAYARQFLGLMDKPDVDSIEGLSPAISISQKSVSHNPRSTVGTVTEIYDYLRLLFARIGHPHCPQCGREIVQQNLDQIVESMMALMAKETRAQPGGKPARWLLLAPVVRSRKGEFSQLFADLRGKGFTRVRIDGKIFDLQTDDFVLIKTNRHTIEVEVSRLTTAKKQAVEKKFLADMVEQALELADGLVLLTAVRDASFDFPTRPQQLQDFLFSERFACPNCNLNLPEIEPRIFSFNTPHGACQTCNGLGKILKVDPALILSERISIMEGAIVPLAHHFEQDTWLARLIITVCQEHAIPLREALTNINAQQKEVLLQGTGNREYLVEGENRFGRQTSISETFPGLLQLLQDKYLQTQSEYMRERIERFMRQEICPACTGTRLKPEALAVTIKQLNIAQVTQLTVKDARTWSEDLALVSREAQIGLPITSEINNRLRFLTSVGLDYLTLARETSTLAGGEAQRIMLASQIGSGLTGVLYVLDEPSIGLHQRDNARLIRTLKQLRDLGNTVIVVEHDRETIESADYVVDFGPGGGKHGGKIVAQGTVQEVKQNTRSLTADYLAGRREIVIGNSKFVIGTRRGDSNSTSQEVIKEKSELRITNYELPRQKKLHLTRCCQYNLKSIDIEFPLGKLICVTGVSGSGKSTLVVETLYKGLKQIFNPYYKETPGKFKQITGYGYLSSVQLIDQSPIGRTPRSNPATYTKAFDHIRELFANTQLARQRGYKKGRFSFNVKGGRCEACEGQGENRIEMQFMADVYVKCEVCQGKRYNSSTLDVTYKDKNITQVLAMTVEEARGFFQNIPWLAHKLDTLAEVGLSYIELGQPAPILSGGEAQRVKLAAELSKQGRGETLYILDEPTTGLHFHDLIKLLKVLRKLVAKGNTVVVIEHNLDVIKNADWVIDLGPEGGDLGGNVVAATTPAQLARVESSYTGQYLRRMLT